MRQSHVGNLISDFGKGIYRPLKFDGNPGIGSYVAAVSRRYTGPVAKGAGEKHHKAGRGQHYDFHLAAKEE